MSNPIFIHGELKLVASSDAKFLFISKMPNSILEKLTPSLHREFDLKISNPTSHSVHVGESD